MRIDGLSPFGGTDFKRVHKAGAFDKKKVSFKETLSTFLTDVNTAQKTSSDALRAMLAGEITDVHQVMSKSEEAKVAFNMLTEMRTKVLESYNEIIRLRL